MPKKVIKAAVAVVVLVGLGFLFMRSLGSSRSEPTLFVAAAESSFERWMPLRADPKVDCVAPIEIASE